jgi:hypothetical protein
MIFRIGGNLEASPEHCAAVRLRVGDASRGADLSGTAAQDDDPACLGQRRRRRRAHHRREDGRHPRPAFRHRERARRVGADRHAGRRPRRARRLHRARPQRRRDHHAAQHAQRRRLRSLQGLRPGDAARRHRMGAGRQSVVSGEDGRRTRRARQGEAGRHQFRLGRLWEPAAYRGRDVHARDESADDACAVSRADTGDQRSRRRACLGDVHSAVDGDVASGRPPAGARFDDAQTAAAACRRRPNHGGIRCARLCLRDLGGADGAAQVCF